MNLPGRLVIAGLSVRAAAEAARRDGFEVLALDLFGDADTRAASRSWQPLDALATATTTADPCVLTSGFESAADQAAVRHLPLLGTAPEAIARVRDPRRFFAGLAACSIAHPEVRHTAPAEEGGWLCKDFGSSGGTQVLPASGLALPDAPQRYWQRRIDDARPASLTFIAGDGLAAVLGFNRQLVHPTSSQPWQFGGLIGPLPSGARAWAGLQDLADRLTREFALRGLVSVDLLQGPRGLLVLEVNARLPASLVLYGAEGGLMRAHVQACLTGLLPDEATLQRLRGTRPRGLEIVRLDRPWMLDDKAVSTLQCSASVLGLHDLPAGPQHIDAGDPLCSIEVTGPPGATEDDVRQALLTGMKRLRRLIDDFDHTAAGGLRAERQHPGRREAGCAAGALG